MLIGLLVGSSFGIFFSNEDTGEETMQEVIREINYEYLAEIEKIFGQSVAIIVDGLTKMVTLEIEDKEEAHIENLRKMLLAMSKDIRVIFIKLCDRLQVLS